MNTPYDHYNTHYDNNVYHSVQMAVLQGLHGELLCSIAQEDAWLATEPTHTIMNKVIDAALEISGVEYPRSALRSLMLLALQHSLSDETIRTIADHLHLFEQSGDTHAHDFVATITVIRHTNRTEPLLHEAIRSASEIHSKEGRCAYHLLTAAHALTESAMILLKEGDSGYMREKLMRGQEYLDGATEKYMVNR